MSSSTDPKTWLAVIPARNEAATVAQIVAGVRQALGCSVLVVNDASTDATADIARAAGATVIELPYSLGAWGATQAGLRFANRNGFRRVVALDADGQHHPDALPALVAAHHETGADVMIGTFIERLSPAKRLAYRYFRLLTGIDVKDFTSGLRVYNRRAIRTLASREASLLDFQDLGVLMLLKKKGLSVREAQTVMSPRQVGNSRVFSSWLKVAGYMLETTVLCIAQIGARAPIAPKRRSAEGSA